MRNLAWIGLIVLMVTLCTASQQPVKAYEGKAYPISFSYHENWILEGDTAGDNLLSLYSPEAVSTRKQHTYLVLGIKTELYFSNNNNQLKYRWTRGNY